MLPLPPLSMLAMMSMMMRMMRMMMTMMGTGWSAVPGYTDGQTVEG